MGSKDHLPNAEETSRKRNRDIKKVTSIAYISNPPVLTREVDSVGIVARTTGEVRDTDFPILANIEDLTDNIFTVVAGATKTIQIELGKQEAQFHRLLLDDDGGTITDFVIDMVGLAKNKALEFIADIETVFAGLPTITFNPPLAGLPSAFGDTGTNEFKLLISAIDTPIKTSFEVLNGADAGGLTEPVIFGVNTLTPQTLPTTTTIAWNTNNPQQITLDRAVEFDFTNLPASGSYEGILVIIDIDAIGGFDSPIWPASLTNPPVIPTTALTRFSVMLYTIDNGTTVTHATSVGSSTGGSALLSNVVIDVNKDWLNFSISNLGGLTMSGDIDVSTFDILNIDRVRFAPSSGVADGVGNPQIYLDETIGDANLVFNNIDTKVFIWTHSNVIGLQETSTLLQKSGVDSTQFIRLVNTFSTPATGALGAFEISGVNDTPTQLTMAFFAGSIVDITSNGSGSAQVGVAIAGVQTDFIRINDNDNGLVDILAQLDMNANDILMGAGANITAGGAGEGMTNIGHLDFTDNLATPAAPLSIFSDGTDIFANTGSGTVNFTNIGAVGANTTLSNLTSPTAINQIINMGTNSITFNPSTVLIGSASTTELNIQFPTATEVLNLVWETDTTPVEKWAFSDTALTGANITLGNTLAINDSSTDPVFNGIFLRNGDDMKLFINSFEVRNEITGASGTANFVSYRDDALVSNGDELGSLRFDGNNNSNVQTQYARILGGVGDVSNFGLLALQVRGNNSSLTTGLMLTGDDNVASRSYLTIDARIDSDLAFGFDGAGSLDAKISPVSAATTLQIVVQDNAAFINGDNGMLACPVVSSLTPTLASLDAAFGTHIGACGVFNTSSANVNIGWKSRSDEWVVIAIPSGSGTVVGEHFN